MAESRWVWRLASHVHGFHWYTTLCLMLTCIVTFLFWPCRCRRCMMLLNPICIYMIYAFSGSIALQAQGLKPRERLFQENSVHRGVKVQRWVKPYEAGRRENTWTQWTLLYICSLVYIVYIVYICLHILHILHILHFLHFHTCQHLVNWSHLSFWTCFVASNELSSGRVWWDALRRSWLTCTSHY